MRDTLIEKQLQFLSCESQSSIVHGCPEGLESGIVPAAPGVPRSPLQPARQHGTQVADRSTREERGSGLNGGQFSRSKAKALTNAPPPVGVGTQLCTDPGKVSLREP